MLENIKLLLGIASNEKDKLIQLLINHAIDDAKEISGREDIYTMSSLIEKMVVFNYNRLGTEGLESESYSGVNYHYSQDYPEAILRSLKQFKRKLRTY